MKRIFSLLVVVLATLSTFAKPKTDAYLMIYFSDSDHCLHMAVSMDGYEFTAVNDNYPVIAGDTIAEQKGLRDPYILRGPDGTYYVAATDLHIFAKQYGYRTTEFERDQQEFGWGNNKNLALLKSKDLIHWEHSLVRVQQMEGFHDIGATWAPELIWDEKAKAVMIYWTIRRGNGACKLYYAYANKEFTGFATEPKLLFEKTIGDHTALDGDIVKGDDGRYYLHYAEYDEGFSGIMVAVSDNITGPYTFQPEIIDKEEKACEAPNVWKRYGTDTYVLMYDCFGRRPHNFGFLETKDFKTYTDIGHFNEEGSKMKTTNFSSPKHGAVTPISKADAQKLLDYWKENPVHHDHGFDMNGMFGMHPKVDVFKTKSGKNLVITPIKHGSLRISYNGKEIEVDPVTKLAPETDYSKLPKADYIFVTHEHFDHCDKVAVEQLMKDGTVIIANENAAKILQKGEVMKNGDTRILTDFKVDAVPAYNNSADKQNFHPKGRDNGYILTIDGLRIYIAGDTEDIEELKGVKDIDVAFLPCNLPYTMTPQQVANAAKIIMPKVLFPYHYGETKIEQVTELLKGSGIDVRIINYQ